MLQSSLILWFFSSIISFKTFSLFNMVGLQMQNEQAELLVFDSKAQWSKQALIILGSLLVLNVPLESVFWLSNCYLLYFFIIKSLLLIFQLQIDSSKINFVIKFWKPNNIFYLSSSIILKYPFRYHTRMQEYNPLLQKRQTYKSKLKITLIVLNLALSCLYIGYCLVYFGRLNDRDNLTQLLKQLIQNQNISLGLINGCIPFGAIFGSLISSYLMRKLSRRKFLLFWNIIALIAGGCTYIPNIQTLLLSRILQGISVGAFCVITPLIIKEIAPTQVSGIFGSFTQLFIATGIFVAYILDYFLQLNSDYKTEIKYFYIMLCVPKMIVLIQTAILFFVFPYQTPRYLMSVGREQEARKLIQLIYKEQYVDYIFMQKTADMIVCGIPRNNEILTNNSQTTSRDKFSNKIPMIVGMNLSTLQQFSGINAIAIYGGQLIGNLCDETCDYNLITSLLNLMAVVATFASSFLLLKFGRKTIIQFGAIFLGVGNLIVAVGVIYLGQIVATIGLCVYLAVFGLTLGPLVWLYIPEIVEDKIVPLTTAVNWACASLVVIVLPIVGQFFIDDKDKKDNQNYYGGVVFIFAAWCFGSFFFNRKYVIESKDKTFRDIQYQFSTLRLC